MSWRTVVLSKRAKIEYSLGYMVIRGEEVHRIFMEEVETVMIETTAVSLTAAWINECLHQKIKIIFCDERRNPAGEILPYRGSHDSSRQIRSQLKWDSCLKKEIWAQIVKEKIDKQKQVLIAFECSKEARLLERYMKEVEPGDITNREGHAAKVYFNALWGKDFSRRDETVENGALNYGYAVILSACNREIAASGYMTQIGLFHDNIFNPFNLGSDLMEPFRPMVDMIVLRMAPQKLTTEEKHQLIDILNRQVLIKGKKTTVTHAIGIYCRSVFRALEEQDLSLLSFYSEIYEE